MDAKINLIAEDRTRAAFSSAKKQLFDLDTSASVLKSNFVALVGVLALPAAYIAFDRLARQAGNFQDMAEKVGDSAQAIASLNVAAGTAGTSMDLIVGASIKLTKNLTGVDDESKAAGAAIAALGLDLKDFKNLAPADQLESVARALGGFEEGAGKTAVAVALLGKSGAELLPFLKELVAEGGRQVILTDRQIRLADAYSDKNARLKTQINLHAQAIVTEMLPAYNELSGAFLDVVKQITGVEAGVNGLSKNNGIGEFATDAVDKLVGLIDFLDSSQRVIRIFAIAASTGPKINLFNIENVSKNISDAKKQIDSIALGSYLGDKLANRRAINRAADEQTAKEDFRRLELMGNRPKPKKPKLPFNGPQDKDKAGQEAKATLAAEIEFIKKSGQGLVSAYGNSERIMDAMRASGLVSDADYYESRRGFILLNSKAKEDELTAEIARYQQERLTGKEKIDNDKKIAESESNLAMQRAKTTADLEVLSIQQADANQRIKRSYVEARVSAQEYLNTTDRQYQRELAAVAMGSNARARFSGQNQIDDKYQSQRDELENNRRLLKMEGNFTTEARDQYEQRLAIINEFQSKALSGWEAHYDKLLEEEGKWSNGASRAMQNYVDQAARLADQTENAFSNAFKGMEDALVDYVLTGKASFSDLAKSIIADIARIIVKQQISNAIGVAGTGGNAGTGIMGWLGGFFSGGAAAGGTAAPLLSAAGGFDIPAGMNPVTQLHEREMVLPAEHADVIRGLTRTGSMGEGSQTVNIYNNTSAQVETRKRQTPHGMTTDVIIRQVEDALADRMSAGTGSLFGAMGSRFNLQTAVG